MTLKNHEGESEALFSPSLLEEEDAGPSAKKPQSTSSANKELLCLSCKTPEGSVCLPFFRTYDWLLAEEKLVLQPEVYMNQGSPWTRQAPFLEDSVPASGFFPYYRSKEDSLPSLAFPSRWHEHSQDSLPGGKAQEDWFCETPVRDRCPDSAASSDFISWSSHLLAPGPMLLLSAGSSCDSLSGTQGFCATGFVPYYRSPEEKLHTAPGPPASLSRRD
ncbi:uncharacterized protein LOC134471691 [Cavia porcellus]|uniref:uncharacterized protein LOC134471691 n=1 Tax=Cavia porcellus TaxID=10141 RepID=UPI00035106CE